MRISKFADRWEIVNRFGRVVFASTDREFVEWLFKEAYNATD